MCTFFHYEIKSIWVVFHFYFQQELLKIKVKFGCSIDLNYFMIKVKKYSYPIASGIKCVLLLLFIKKNLLIILYNKIYLKREILIYLLLCGYVAAVVWWEPDLSLENRARTTAVRNFLQWRPNGKYRGWMQGWKKDDEWIS